MKTKFYIGIVFLFASVLVGCDNYMDVGPILEDDSALPRLVINGTVTNTDHESLQGIYISVIGVRELNESDILNYNCAITDSVGKYTIMRYRGRELPTQVTVVATDSTGVYEEKLLFPSVTYDSITMPNGIKKPHNAFVTADFVLSKQ